MWASYKNFILNFGNVLRSFRHGQKPTRPTRTTPGVKYLYLD